MSSSGNYNSVQQRIVQQSQAYSSQLLAQKLGELEERITGLVDSRKQDREALHRLAKFVSDLGVELPEDIQSIVSTCMEDLLLKAEKPDTQPP